MENVQELQATADRPLSSSWISDELLIKTQRVWSKAYGRSVDREEAIEILTNVKQLAEVLLRAKQEIKSK